jgi:hypothetical protein
MTKRRRGIVFAATAVILLGFCALAFVAIGYLAAQGTATFDWGAASTAATAAGTLGLAIVTGWLAYTTSVDVSATRRLADRAEQDAAERREPIVAIQGFEIGRVIPDPASPQVKWAITVILTNVGLGPALNVALSPMLKDVSDSIRFSPEMKVLSTLAPTATEKLDFELVTHAPVTVIGEENEYAFFRPSGARCPVHACDSSEQTLVRRRLPRSLARTEAVPRPARARSRAGGRVTTRQGVGRSGPPGVGTRVGRRTGAGRWMRRERSYCVSWTVSTCPWTPGW